MRFTLATAAAALLSGCAPGLRGPAARPAEGILLSPDQGDALSLVFEHPSVTRYYATTALPPGFTYPEASRRDSALGIRRDPTPISAATSSLNRARSTTIPNRPDQILFFAPPVRFPR